MRWDDKSAHTCFSSSAASCLWRTHDHKEISSLVSNTTHLSQRVSHSWPREDCICCHGICKIKCWTTVIWSSGAKTFQMRLPFSFFPLLLLIVVELTGSDEGSLCFTMVGALPQKSHDAHCDYLWLSPCMASLTRSPCVAFQIRSWTESLPLSF